MSLNSTPSSERIHIGFFGKTNVGKSSVVNALTGQNLSLVSDVKGTTTDPVNKAMELLPLGPVVVIDTAGYDDETELGKLRVDKTLSVLNKIDIAVLVVDAREGVSEIDNNIINEFKTKNIKYVVVYNKMDLLNSPKILNSNEIYVSSLNNTNIYELKELIAKIYGTDVNEQFLVKDIIQKNDVVILVTPIDESAPKGRLILPQQQVIRELLEVGAITMVVQVEELAKTIEILGSKPKLVITDSQVFGIVQKIVPEDIYLTSFSILFARYKGVLKDAVKGAIALEYLKDGDKILIAEGCTHHRQCNDIGTVKLPTWIKNYTCKQLDFEFTSGGTFPEDLSKYALIVHCGGCMLKDKEVLFRYKNAKNNEIKITNYGISIAYMNKILKRSVEIFKDIVSEIQ